MREIHFKDRLISSLDVALKTLSHSTAGTARPNPAAGLPEECDNKRLSAGLMRINHTGEVCAQALYQGQALTARNPALVKKLEQASLEENDHLQWCESRLKELGSRASFLNFFWYPTSLMLGTIAGLLGDRWSLGFLSETERQVSRHLETHLEKLPVNDHKSRAIVSQMLIDETAHADWAENLGAATLPTPIKKAMAGMALVMKSIVRRI